jgi:hypothetical protein
MSANCSNQSSIAVGILDLCRRFIDKCLLSHSNYVSSAMRFGTQLIELMYDIASSVNLQTNDYGILFKWVQAMTVNDSLSKSQILT